MKRFVFLLFAVVLSISVFSQNEKYYKVKVFADENQLLEMAESGIDITEGVIKEGVFIISDYSGNEISVIENLGLTYEILIDDVSQYYVDRNIGKSKNVDDYKGISDWPVPENFEFGAMNGHATFDEIVAHLDNMFDLFPNLITQKESIGQSHENRELWMVKISDNPGSVEDEAQVLYTALHHAREPAGVMTLLYYMYYILENYESDPFIQSLVDNTEMYFVPVINPDGYVYNEQTNPNGGGMWRKNRRDNNVPGCMGVDPNRNYGYMWGIDNQGSSPDPCDETYRGPEAFSEPEIQAIRDLCNEHEFKNAMNYHTFSNLLLYAWGYTPDPSPDDALFYAHSVLYTMDSHYTFGAGSTTIYPTNGGSDDWMYGEQTTKPKILAYTPELGGGDDGFWCAIDRIIPIAQENMIQNILTAAFAGRFAGVEDISPTVFGEVTGHIKFNIMRLGLMDGGTFTVDVEPLSPEILSVGDPISFTNMNMLEMAVDSIDFTLDPSILSGTSLQFVLSVDNGDYIITDTLNKIYGEAVTLFEDDCNNLDNWITPSWDLTTSTYVSPPASITDSPFGDYPNNHTSGVFLTEEIDLIEVGFAMLTFKAKWEIEQGWDYVQCHVSTNGGSSWEALEGKYTVTGNEYQATGQPVYDGFQTNWVEEEIDITQYIGNSVTFRFFLKTDQAVTEDGFYFDDFAVMAVENATVGMEEVNGSNITISEPIPNPASDRVQFIISAKQKNSNLKFNVISTTGQVVYSNYLEDGQNRLTIQTESWKPGMYYFYAEGKNYRTEMRKLIIL